MKIDLKKTIPSYAAKRGTFEVIEVSAMRYLKVDGHGDPNTSQEFKDALEALYPVAYKLKFASKSLLGKDYVVMPLEGLWWSKDMEAFTTTRDKSKWDWTMMIMQPEWITEEMFKEAIRAMEKKGAPTSLSKIRFEILEEGACVQTLHIGSFDDEGPVLEKMHAQFIPEQGLTMRGLHHEIYFSDFRKTDAHKMRTLLRQPVAFKAP